MAAKVGMVAKVGMAAKVVDASCKREVAKEVAVKEVVGIAMAAKEVAVKEVAAITEAAAKEVAKALNLTRAVRRTSPCT